MPRNKGFVSDEKAQPDDQPCLLEHGPAEDPNLIPPERWTWWPLTLSELSSLFCPVIGFVAILVTILARRDYTMKRYDSSLVKRTVAYKLSIAAVLVGALIIILVVLFLLQTKFSRLWTSTVEP